MSDVFISYAREDTAVAARIAEAVQRLGLSVWWDRHLLAGSVFDQTIENELHRARCVLVLWSESSVKSDWVRAEASIGAQRRTLVPAAIRAVQLPLAFTMLHTANLCSWTGDLWQPEFQSLLQSIRMKLGHSGQRLVAPNMIHSGPSHHPVIRLQWQVELIRSTLCRRAFRVARGGETYTVEYRRTWTYESVTVNEATVEMNRKWMTLQRRFDFRLVAGDSETRGMVIANVDPLMWTIRGIQLTLDGTVVHSEGQL